MNKLFLFTKVPSVNHYWKTAKGGHRYIVPQGQIFKKQVAECARKSHFICFEGDVEVKINWYKKGRARGDLDNILKVIFDSLIGFAYRDDKQIKRFSATMWEQTGKDAIEVCVSELDLTSEKKKVFWQQEE